MKANIEQRADGTFIAYDIDGKADLISIGSSIQECKDHFVEILEKRKACFKSVPADYNEPVEFLVIEDLDFSILRQRKLLYLTDFFKSCGHRCAEDGYHCAIESYKTDRYPDWLYYIKGLELTEEEKAEEEEEEKKFKEKWIAQRALDGADSRSDEAVTEYSFTELDSNLFSDDFEEAAKDKVAFAEILKIWREGYKGWGRICVGGEHNGSLFWHIVNKYFKHQEYYGIISDGISEFFDELKSSGEN